MSAYPSSKGGRQRLEHYFTVIRSLWGLNESVECLPANLRPSPDPLQWPLQVAMALKDFAEATSDDMEKAHLLIDLSVDARRNSNNQDDENYETVQVQDIRTAIKLSKGLNSNAGGKRYKSEVKSKEMVSTTDLGKRAMSRSPDIRETRSKKRMKNDADLTKKNQTTVAERRVPALVGWKMSTSPVLQQAFAMQSTTRRRSSQNSQEPENKSQLKPLVANDSDVESTAGRVSNDTTSRQGSVPSYPSSATPRAPSSTVNESVPTRSIDRSNENCSEQANLDDRTVRSRSSLCESPSMRFLSRNTPTPTSTEHTQETSNEYWEHPPIPVISTNSLRQHHLPPLHIATSNQIPETTRESASLAPPTASYVPKSQWAMNTPLPFTPSWLLPTPTTLQTSPRHCPTPGSAMELPPLSAMLDYVDARKAWTKYLEEPHDDSVSKKPIESNGEEASHDIEVLRCELVEAEAALRVAKLQALIAKSSAQNNALEKA